MPSVHAILIPLLWLAWLAYWMISAIGAKETRRQESFASMLVHVVPLIVGAWLIWARSLPGGVLGGRVLPATEATYWVGVVMVALGLGFSVWARRCLGRNWSGTVTVKQDHELVRSGPYRYVRHPIYTGLLLAFAGCAVVRGEWRGVVAVVLIGASFWIKLRHEERWMIETFGEEYLRYRSEVAALIPFVL